MQVRRIRIDGAFSPAVSRALPILTSRDYFRSCQNDYQYKVCSGVRQCSLKKKKTLQDFADEVCRARSGYAIRIPAQGKKQCNVMGMFVVHFLF